MEELIKRYIQLMEEAISTDILKDKNWIKYNMIVKKIWSLQDKILDRDDYVEIYTNVLEITNEDKYWQLHNSLSESLYFKDKILCLEIQEKSKWLSVRNIERINQLREELVKEWKLPKKRFFWKIFK